MEHAVASVDSTSRPDVDLVAGKIRTLRAETADGMGC